MRKTVKMMIIAAAAVIVPGGLWLFGDRTRIHPPAIDEVLGYLRAAERIWITRLHFDVEAQTASALTLLDSRNSDDVTAFMDLLEAVLNNSQVETTISRMRIFTPDYKVELACRKWAAIEFVFFEDTYAACLRNEEYYFFAELNRDDADRLKHFFERQSIKH